MPPIARSWPLTPIASIRKGDLADLSRLAEDLLGAALATRHSEALLVRAQASCLSWLSVGDRPQRCGYSSLSRLALEALGLSPRTVRERLSISRLFARFPAVERAFLDGRMSACQTLAAAPIFDELSGDDEEAIARWIDTAGRVSVRALRYEVRRRRGIKVERGASGAVDPGPNNATDAPTAGTGPCKPPDSPGADAAPGELIDPTTINAIDPSASGAIDPPSPDATDTSALGTGGAETFDISTPDANDPQGRMISISAPVGFQVVFDQTIDLARKVLGWDAPIHECIAAILAESNWTGVGSTPKDPRWLMPPDGIHLRPRTEVPIRPEAIRHARLTLLQVRGYVRDLLDIVESGEPTSPRDALNRLRQIQLLRAPQRVLLAHLIRDLRRTYAMDLLGYRSMADLVEDRLGLSERSARNRVAESLLFESEQELEQAVGRGEISLMQAHLIRRMQHGVAVGPFVERARQVSWRQFQRECRLLDLLRKCGLGGLTGRPLPQSHVEDALIEALGGDRDAIEERLRALGVPPIPGDGSGDPAESGSAVAGPTVTGGAVDDSRVADPAMTEPGAVDPATNPIVMDRLEALVEMLAATMWDDVPQATAPDRQLSAAVGAAPAAGIDSQLTEPSAQSTGKLDRQLSAAVDPHIKIRFWAPNSTADDFHAVIDRFRKQHTPRIPVWAAVVVIFAQVTMEWEREDPERRPVRAKILKRDHYRCIVPGCGRRSQLEDHHLEYRSRGGGNEDSNRGTLCHGHHAHGVHRGYVRIIGKAPHALRFELGCLEAGPPLFVYYGQMKVAGPWVWSRWRS